MNTTATPPRVRSARVIFTTAVIEAMRFTDTGEEDQPATDAPLHPEDHSKLTDDCSKFWEQVGHLVHDEFHATRRLTQRPDAGFENWADAVRSAGHDFWLTRNGHGAGFWDGDWTLHGDALTTASEAAGSLGVYEGDDGSLCIDGLS